jgi:hypothetical protein
MPSGKRVELKDFAGRWQLTRHIQPQDGAPAVFEGAAFWTPADGGLAYHETGQISLPGQVPMQAERRYFWADDLSIYFDDGRFFHRVPCAGGQTGHWCAPDQYDVTYDFGGWPAFRVTWDVQGPRKAYRSTSEYRRC